MPKVSAAHLDARRRGILAAAQRCVARQGVAATTMRDICRAANLSPGGVYRYFSGKDKILAALAAQRQQQVDRFFRTVSNEDKSRSELLTAIQGLARALDGESARDGLHLDLHLWSEAPVSPAVRQALADGQHRIVGKLAASLQAESELDREGLARALLALFQGLALQKVLDPEIELGPLVERLTRLLEE
jgi:AcrR family transcriptional regulator